MTSEFARFIQEQNATSEAPLPLAHTTDGFRFRSLVRTPRLTLAPCPVYKEDLGYFFYAKPAYRPHFDVGPTSLLAYSPVSFILESVEAPAPVRIMPFDSGAMNGEFFKD